LRWIYTLAFLFCTTAACYTQEVPNSDQLVQLKLVQEEKTIEPGRPFWIAIHLSVADNWHSYWKNPGDAGMATSIELTLPDGYVSSPIVWPTPERFNTDSMVGFGYEGDITFLAQIMPPSTVSATSPTITATVNWLVCSDTACVPGQSEASKELTIQNGVPEIDPDHISLFTDARAHVPNKLYNVKAFHEDKDNTIKMQLKLPFSKGTQLLSVDFFPEESSLIDHSNATSFVATTEDDEQQYSIVLKPHPQSENSLSKVLKGIVVALDSKGITHAFDVEADFVKSIITNAPSPESVAIDLGFSEENINLVMAIFLAFIGGIILNLMPCVLPIISFKILSFVKMANQSRRLIFKHGLAFTGGVLTSFWALAGALLILQAYGQSVGWGFQLQEPIFVAILAAVLLILSLSLFGVFELGTSVMSLAGKVQTQDTLKGSFVGGILATALATPCTGPFLGSAIGFAMSAPAIDALVIFTSLGLGMALPYLLLSAFPILLRFVPKPGAWMTVFKELMGFLMLMSVLWLAWVFGAQTNTLSLSILLAAFVAFAFGCWVYGKWGTPIRSRVTRSIGRIFALACFGLGIYAIIISTEPWGVTAVGQEIASGAAHGDWEPYSPQRLAELQKKGVPVLVDFTAKWCLICQVNHLVLTHDDVTSKLNERGVVKMKADWTKRDPIITEELRKQGRSGVPLYLLYGSGEDSPQILPQVLTPEIVLQYVSTI